MVEDAGLSNTVKSNWLELAAELASGMASGEGGLSGSGVIGEGWVGWGMEPFRVACSSGGDWVVYWNGSASTMKSKTSE